jgi:hypothetical protein
LQNFEAVDFRLAHAKLHQNLEPTNRTFLLGGKPGHFYLGPIRMTEGSLTAGLVD